MSLLLRSTTHLTSRLTNCSATFYISRN